MSLSQQEKQQLFRKKLQTEGADGFADGPRPWEQWDESGSQDNDRIWEGSARRIYPKHKKKTSFGDRLLSGLAVIALATLMVGVAGVYLSTMTTPQLASSGIQPAPIIADRHSPTSEPDLIETPDTLATLETLSPPAAGNTASLELDKKVVLEPALQPAPIVPAEHIDRVAVETVITETAVTTTVYKQQLSQEHPVRIATIETTPPAFSAEADETGEPLAAASDIVEDTTAITETAANEQTVTSTLMTEPVEQQAAQPVMLATADEQETAAAPAATSAQPEETEVIAAAADEQQASAAPTELAPPEEVEVATATQQDTAAEVNPAVIETPAAIALSSTDTGIDATPDPSREIETATQTPVLPDAKTGKWVINLSSYTRKSTAERMLAVFKSKGVEAEIFSTTINDKPMHRIRLAGFQSSRAASSEIPALEKTLGLEGAWVSRR